ncbi:Yip1 family protein [Tabrizicola sp.]|uniref:Yip1 family protein n=1 Tax=Tabrizicola sp. TaxID=2005166 RepID=UPI002869FB19|nr:Yip1 family protein [Tabrizicola sp.]
MPHLIDTLVGLARLSLQDPRKGARALLDMDVPLPARSAGLFLMAVASAILMHLGAMLLPPTDDAVANFVTGSPIRSAIMQFVVLAVSVVLIHRIGRFQGGTGTFDDSMLIVVWLQVLMLMLQVVQLVALAVSPPLAGIINLAGLVLFFWLITSFIAELHGFTSRRAVFVGIVITMFAVAFVLVFVMILILGPEALSNV